MLNFFFFFLLTIRYINVSKTYAVKTAAQILCVIIIIKVVESVLVR